jgi:hypothetical protein
MTQKKQANICKLIRTFICELEIRAQGLSLTERTHTVTSFLLYIYIYIKGKVKALPITGHEGPEGEQIYSSTLSSTSALDGVSVQFHAPAALPPAKDPVPIV